MLSSYIERVRYRRYLSHRLSSIKRGQRSYSQHQEDLVAEYLLGSINRFIDIGANDGISGSNTFLFAERGAEGLCFEPVQEYYTIAKKLLKAYPKVRIIKEGISDKEGTAKIHVQGYLGQTSSLLLDATSDPLQSSETIKIRPLNYWVRTYPRFAQVDLISVDVEGAELEVIRGIDFNQISCRCFIVETDKVKADTLDQLLGPNGFIAVVQNEANTFWMQHNELKSAIFKQLVDTFPDYKVIAQV